MAVPSSTAELCPSFWLLQWSVEKGKGPGEPWVGVARQRELQALDENSSTMPLPEGSGHCLQIFLKNQCSLGVIIESCSFGLEGTFKGLLVQLPWHEQGHYQVHQVHHQVILVLQQISVRRKSGLFTVLCSSPCLLQSGRTWTGSTCLFMVRGEWNQCL